MARRHLSGRNKAQLPKSVEVDGHEIPVARSAATFIYLSQDGSWPKEPLVALDYDATWMTEGTTFDLKDLRPGLDMGLTTWVQILDSHSTVEVHRGKWGQVRRKVLAVPLNEEAR
jgi:hypothetical protein